MAIILDCLHSVGILFSIKHLFSFVSSHLWALGPRFFSCCWPHPSTEKWWRGPTTVSTHTGRWYPPASGSTGGPTSTGAIHKSVTFRCVFMLVQLNKCVVVSGTDLQRGHSGDRLLLYALFNHPRLLIQVARVQKAQFSYRLDGLVP